MSTQPIERSPNSITSRSEVTPAGALMTSANGSLWRASAHTRGGERLFVLDGTDLKTCPRWVMSTEAELAAAVGPLTAVNGAAVADRPAAATEPVPLVRRAGDAA